MTKLIVAFRNFAKGHKIVLVCDMCNSVESCAFCCE
jgi:hypothetical protein